VADGVLKGGVDPDHQDDDADEPVSAQQEIDDLNARIKELLDENEILDKGLNRMTQAAETLRQENMRLSARIGGLHARLKGIEPS
jgi:predicted RNase H-like nuclease (RuvC/YqgF family)